MTHYYFAYGSNMNHHQMADRCPKAKPVFAGFLSNYRPVMRNHADIEEAEEERVCGVVWSVTDDCLKRLDVYEAVPSYYFRHQVRVERLPMGFTDGSLAREAHCWVYQMTLENSRHYGCPHPVYVRGCQLGAKYFGVPFEFKMG